MTVYGAVPDPPEPGYPPSTPSAIQRGQERMNESREGPWSCPTSPARQQPPELPHSSARAPPAHPVAPTEQRRSGRRAPCRHARRRSPQPEVTVQAEKTPAPRLESQPWASPPPAARRPRLPRGRHPELPYLQAWAHPPSQTSFHCRAPCSPPVAHLGSKQNNIRIGRIRSTHHEGSPAKQLVHCQRMKADAPLSPISRVVIICSLKSGVACRTLSLCLSLQSVPPV